ncbi:MAG: hypothetical protein JGK03_15495 [Microcoleus sp. PH2017_25_DOB_D_A]|jgi:hypothetical protein|uniref:hypothetical protein n=1 Tax=unclassified Microcoleus TaxID=2642155 RepID=UPI001D564B2F|nr:MULTISPECIES: hypothetical protein [unclassified Microcoleus]MCC3498344.1 hypothetical protein [Microcoleus sp. PH2017_15_JOR_U_A]MCC3509527.1 hypothetical protein [Microcoleus sp. PH2017_17_BER_D_A]MCC3535577.1 hypothetical protein [Microcoleus sp. PH2017_25_DOB_D_A]MCC3545454.1 hypothetical protein [Microcoleus sp. PH2017_24_DOB_U_A]
MSEKLSVICASILFAAIPVMLVYLVKSSYHDGYKQAVKDLPPTVVQVSQNIDNSTHNHYQFAPSLGSKQLMLNQLDYSVLWS